MEHILYVDRRMPTVATCMHSGRGLIAFRSNEVGKRK